MTTTELEHLYFNWLYRLVCDDRYDGNGRNSYQRLLTFLHETTFKWKGRPEYDRSRALDGIDLRYEFGYRKHISKTSIAQQLNTRECSILEMMIALCIRCEDIAYDNAYGDRTGTWFWYMLNSLGLASMNDLEYDESVASRVIEDFQTGNYARNGEGGLFTLSETTEDVRDHELWWQMSHFLSEQGI